MNRPIAGERWLLGAAALSLLAVGVALVSEHGFDMRPCPWCVLQRLEFVIVAMFALVPSLWRTRTGFLLGAAGVIAVANLGLLSALWQHFVAGASASCNLTLADRIIGALQLDSLLPDVFAATASCAEAKVDLLGVPYEFWSLATFLLIEAIAVWTVLRGLRRPA